MDGWKRERTEEGEEGEEGEREVNEVEGEVDSSHFAFEQTRARRGGRYGETGSISLCALSFGGGRIIGGCVGTKFSFFLYRRKSRGGREERGAEGAVKKPISLSTRRISFFLPDSLLKSPNSLRE